jgi:RteC protein
MAYYDTLQINEGKADLSDIIDWLEQSLQVNLSRYYRRFMEIKQRKAMSKTRYLDEMRDVVNKRIDDTDALDKERRLARRRNY